MAIDLSKVRAAQEIIMANKAELERQIASLDISIAEYDDALKGRGYIPARRSMNNHRSEQATERGRLRYALKYSQQKTEELDHLACATLLATVRDNL